MIGNAVGVFGVFGVFGVSGAAQAVTAAATPSPAPTPTGGFSEPWEVSPGISGFIAFFLLALALVVIVWFMSRSVRRIDHAAGARPTAPVPPGGIVDHRETPPSSATPTTPATPAPPFTPPPTPSQGLRGESGPH